MINNSMEKINGKLVTFTGIIILVLLIAVLDLFSGNRKQNIFREKLRRQKSVFPVKFPDVLKNSGSMKANK